MDAAHSLDSHGSKIIDTRSGHKVAPSIENSALPETAKLKLPMRTIVADAMPATANHEFKISPQRERTQQTCTRIQPKQTLMRG